MTRAYCLLSVLLISYSAIAQKSLSNSKQTSFFTYIYSISENLVEDLYNGNRLDEKLLVTPIDSFLTTRKVLPVLPQGNYLKVYVEKNKLYYSLIENRTAYLKILNNKKDLQFIVVDSSGNVVKNAEVSIDGRAIPYDAKAGLFRSKYPRKEESLIRVFYSGLANFTEISYDKDDWKERYGFGKWLLEKSPAKFIYPPIVRIFYKIKNESPPYKYRRYKIKSEEKKGVFSGFMVFNKPIYKPLDTVKFKAFVLKGKHRKPAAEELFVRLVHEGVKIPLGQIKPQFKGSYDFNFLLHDSLKLELDKNYTIELYNKKKIFRSGTFRYEEYELKSVSFTLKGDKDEHTKKQLQFLYLKATDENGLNVLDGRVELLIRTKSVIQFRKEKVFVPDTLWRHTLKLDPLGETKVVLPDSIFPDADIKYSAEAVFLNTNNEDKEAEAEFSFYTQGGNDLKFELKQDSLHIAFKDGFQEGSSQVKISAINTSGDTLQTFKSNLPAAIKVNPYSEEYEVEGDSLLDWFDLTEVEADIRPFARRTADSLFITVENPRNVPFWFTILQGNKIVDRGNSVQLDYRVPLKGQGKITFRYSYIWGDESFDQSVEARFAEKQLHLKVRQPLAISPGEQSEIEVRVTDARGNPVEDADLTAYSITSKFDYYGPTIPYFGKSQSGSKDRPQLDSDDGISQASIPLDWNRWGLQLGLDSIEYFRFTHPVTEYRYTEFSSEGLTQISPFVIKNGDIIPVEILYLNEKPVYFSQAEQTERYSFLVDSGLVKIQFRLKDKLVTVKNAVIAKGEKLIVSYNLDASSNKNIEVSSAPVSLSEYEASILNKYMIKVVDTYSPRFATISQPDKVFLLKPSENQWDRPQPKLVGPLSYNIVEFQVKENAPISFLAEPNYWYTFLPGLIKQKSNNGQYPFRAALNTSTPPSFKDHVLTNKEVDSLWIHYLDLRSNTTPIFSNPQVSSQGNGRLAIKIKNTWPQQAAPLIKNILIYNNDNPDFLNIYPGKETDLGYFIPGKYRLFLLLKGEKYVLIENIVIKPDGRNLIQIALDKPSAKDSVSTKLSAFIKQRSIALDEDDKPNRELIKETFNSRFTNSNEYKDSMTGTIYSLMEKEPIPGVSIIVKGTRFGVFTDINGKFKINVPQKGKLVASFIGFDSQESDITASGNINLYLKESVNELQEVVTVGYGASKTGKLEQTLQGRVSGVSLRNYSAGSVVTIRGLNSIAKSGPLYIVDGVPVDKPVKEYSADEIADISILKDDAATAIYGARAANGVVIITTKKGKERAQQEAAEQAASSSLSIRKNFSDYAFWQPQLRTDKDGKARFNVSFPDDITNWRTFFIAMNGKKQSGYFENSIKAFKSVSAVFVSPQFAIAGDSFSPVGKVMNYTTEDASVQRVFNYNGKNVLDGVINVKNAHIDTFKVLAEGADSLRFRYSIQKHSGYSDGEERSIPVFGQGVKETLGIFEALEKDTSVSLSFNPEFGKVTFRAEASLLPVLLVETERLRNYEYLCNEQLSSKLKALLIQKKIKTYQNQPFENDKIIRQLIKKLDDGRRKDGVWGWWKNADPELWISRHAIEGLIDAEKAGFAIPFKKSELIEYLVYQLADYKSKDKLEALLLLRKMDAKVDYISSINLFEKEVQLSKSKLSLNEKLKLLLLKQGLGLPVEIDSLNNHRHSTVFGNIYFGESNNQFFDNSIQNTLLAYKLIKGEGKNMDWIPKMRNFLLEQRQDGHWRNTYESSLILETILPDILTESKKLIPPVLTLSSSDNEEIRTFPFTTTLDATSRLQLKKKGDLPLYITAYQQFWNAEPGKVSKEFRVDTWFENKSVSKITLLKGGQPVVLKADVSVSADANYVLIEIPIPAGCSYDEKEQSWWGSEVHREYFKNKVSIFCRNLKKGNHSFTVKLMPRYDGTFTLNPARLELMYFPKFYGREEIRKVMIGQ